jgi:hypothetical protein
MKPLDGNSRFDPPAEVRRAIIHRQDGSWKGSNPRRRDESAHLRLILNSPEETQKIVEPISAQVLLRHQTKLFFHFSISHRILEVPAVKFDADSLAHARF